jgi:hypothetical protein
MDWLVEADVSEKLAVSIFRAEVGDSTLLDPQGDLTQKNIIGIFIAVDTLNLTKIFTDRPAL